MTISLNSIKTGKEKKPPRIVIYGVDGVGKTTFVSNAPNPVVIATEDGLGELAYARFPVAEKLQDVDEALTALRMEDHDHKTVGIDTLSELEQLIFKQVCNDKGVGSIDDIGFQKGYTFALDYWTEILQKLTDLRDTKNMIPILVGHALIKNHNPPDTEPYDRYQLDLHHKAMAAVRKWADVILFANYKTYIKKDRQGFNERKRAVGTGERVLYTQWRPAHWAKTRCSLPPELPFPKEDSWKVFINAMKHKKEKEAAK